MVYLHHYFRLFCAVSIWTLSFGADQEILENGQRSTVSSICYARCQAMCEDNGGEIPCVTECRRFRSDTWQHLCTQQSCNITCDGLFNQSDPVQFGLPDAPVISILGQKGKPHRATLSWKQIDTTHHDPTTIIYVIEKKTPGTDWEFLVQTRNTSYAIQMDICKTTLFRVAAVTQNGSRGFSEAVLSEDIIIPGKVVDFKLANKAEYSKQFNQIIINITWKPPVGWQENSLSGYFFSKIKPVKSGRCMSPPMPTLTTLQMNKNPVLISYDSIKLPQKDRHGAFGCDYQLQIAAVSRCGKVGQPADLTVSLKDCSDVDVPKCLGTPTPVPPGEVRNITVVPIVYSQNATVTWLPPQELGSAKVIHSYAVQWGPLSHEGLGLILMPDHRISVDGNETRTLMSISQPGVTYGVQVVARSPKDVSDDNGIPWHFFKVKKFTIPVYSTSTPTDDPGVSTLPNGSSGFHQDKIRPSTESPGSASAMIAVYVIVPILICAVIIVTVFYIQKWHRNRTKKRPWAADHPINLGSPSRCLVDNPLYEMGIKKCPDKWEVPHDCLTLGEILGRGAFGQVVKGSMRGFTPAHLKESTSSISDGVEEETEAMIVAVKMLLDYAEETHKEDFMKEIALMKSIGKHSNIVSIIGSCTVKEPLCLIVENVPHGDLLHYLRKHRHLMQEDESAVSCERLTLQDLMSFARQVSVGMEFLSQKGFVHRDLATRNVLVGEKKTVKIGDFGLTRYIYDDKVYVTRKGGKLPLKWMAIESIFDLTFTTSSDVWSFGVVLFELITLGGTPYPTIANKDLLKELQRGYRMEKPDNCSDELYDMMGCCWMEQPSVRPDFTNLRNQLERLMEKNSSSDYLTFNVDENRDYYRMHDATTASSAGGSDEVFEGFNDSGRGSSPHLHEDGSIKEVTSSSSEKQLPKKGDKKQLSKHGNKERFSFEKLDKADPIFLVDSPQSSDQHLLPARSSDSFVIEDGWVGETKL